MNSLSITPCELSIIVQKKKKNKLYEGIQTILNLEL